MRNFFADDGLILAHTVEKRKEIIEELEVIEQQWGLELNKEKE